MLFEPGEIESLRASLISYGATLVLGVARGAGDSADEYWIKAIRYLKPEEIDHIEPIRRPHEYGDVLAFIAHLKDGSQVRLWHHALYDLPGSIDMPVTRDVTIPESLLDLINWYDVSGQKVRTKPVSLHTSVKLPETLEDRLKKLFDEIVESYPDWDFNGDGSQGSFGWDLLTNRSCVDASFNVTSTESFGDEDIMGEPWETA